MKKSFTKRLRITKRGKMLRRTMGQGHFRAKKRTAQLKRRAKLRSLSDEKGIIKKFI